jgi:serine/threonine-protein kinase RsbW
VPGLEDVTPTSFSARLPYDSRAAARARRLVADLVDRCHPSAELVEDATLVVHELVVNGLVHGAPDEQDRIEVSGRVVDGELVISVLDQGTHGTVAAQPFTDHRTHGRGLSMVGMLRRSTGQPGRGSRPAWPSDGS